MRRTRRSPRSARARAFDRLEPRLVMATFNVNSFADILDPPAGTVTLRSAIQAANHSPGPDTINLTGAGDYKITSFAPSTPDNTAGTFTITGSGDLTIANTSGGDAIVDGHHLGGVFDIDPADASKSFIVTLTGLAIDGGATSGDGGGIVVKGAGSLVLNGDSVSGNEALQAGGGIAMDGTGSLTLNASTVVSNSSANSGGGGISSRGGPVTINSRSAISGNVAFLDGGGIEVVGPLHATGAVISNNRAGSGGGGISSEGSGGVSLDGTIFEGNTSVFDGGGYEDNPVAPPVSLRIIDSFIVSNVAMAASGDPTPGNGGGVATSAPSVLVSNSVLQGNVSENDGGGLYIEAHPGNLANSDVRVEGSEITGNRAAGLGGGIADASTGAMLTLTDSTVQDNFAFGRGGGLDVSAADGTASVSNTLFLDDRAGSLGGAIHQEAAGTLAVDASQFTGNSAGDGGGAFYFLGEGTPAHILNDAITVSDSTFNGNLSGGDGGVLILDLEDATGSMGDDTFASNSAGAPGRPGHGGAIDFLASDPQSELTLDYDTINNNTASGAGGGVYHDSGELLVEKTILAQNTAAGAASDYFHNGGTVMETGSNLIGTTAGAGGNFGGDTYTGGLGLAPLLDNGSDGGVYAGSPSTRQVVQTEALLPGSPAINRGGVPLVLEATDARGFPRPVGGMFHGFPLTAGSVGAYEPQYAADATPDRVFVENLFEVLLNRIADPTSLTNSVDFLNGGGNGVTLVQILQGSAEFRDIEAAQLYRRYFDRTPSAAEVTNLANFLAAGNTPEQVAALFIGTPEFFNDYGDNNDVFVEAVYQDTLGRAASPVERGGWDELLAQGGTRAGVATLFVDSTGYLDLLIDAEYPAFLGRMPTPAEEANLARAWPGFTGNQIEAVLLGFGEAFARRT